jgi:lysozyme family protein
MATANYPSPILKPNVLKHEGGKVNNKNDPGGRTNQGVIQLTYNHWRDNKGLPRQSVYLMTDHERDSIYKSGYWDKIRGDYVPSGLDYVLMDAAVNSGPSRSIKLFQKARKISADGIFGTRTMAQVNSLTTEPKLEAAIRASIRERMAFYRRLPTFKHFGRGWTRRANEVLAKSLELMRLKGNIKKDTAAGGGATGVVVENQLPQEDLPWDKLPDTMVWVLLALVIAFMLYNHRSWFGQKLREAKEVVTDFGESRLSPRKFVGLRKKIAEEKTTKAVEDLSELL